MRQSDAATLYPVLSRLMDTEPDLQAPAQNPDICLGSRRIHQMSRFPDPYKHVSHFVVAVLINQVTFLSIQLGCISLRKLVQHLVDTLFPPESQSFQAKIAGKDRHREVYWHGLWRWASQDLALNSDQQRS